MTVVPAFLDDARGALGPAHVITDPEMTASYARDWTGRFGGQASVVLRPGSTDEVRAVVAACREHGVAIVPQGGNTGLVGGSVPLHGEAVISLTRLGRLGPVDVDTGQVTAGAGVPIAALQRRAASAGWVYAVDLASRDTATVGGTIATNAGGLHVLRWGATRAQVLGIEAVLGTGDVVEHLSGLVKDNTGYDLAGLLCGSEGTLGIVTAARLRLVPDAQRRVAVLLGLESVASAVAATGTLRRSLPTLDALEFFLDDGLDLVCTTFGLPRPFATRAPVYLLLEASDTVDPTDRVADAVAVLGGVLASAVAVDSERRDELWRYREAHTEAVNTLGAPHKLDVTLPAPALAGFLAGIGGVVASVAPDARCVLFGHLGDGNVHVNVVGAAVADDPADDPVDAAVLGHVADLGGSISAEHGIGTAKRAYLSLVRSRAQLAAFRAIKTALDPDGILNPSVLLS